MTGEVSLTGRVLPIGGVKQKLLAAHRAGVTTVVIPKRNEPDLDDVPAEVLDKLDVHAGHGRPPGPGAGAGARDERGRAGGSGRGVTDAPAAGTPARWEARVAVRRAVRGPSGAGRRCARRGQPLARACRRS